MNSTVILISLLNDAAVSIFGGLLSSGSTAVAEFMPTVCCLAYLVFLVYNSAEERRHSLLHHLQYLLSCIESGQTERAKDYISQICAEIDAQQVRRFCENEAVNLILSAFANRAEKTGIKMEVSGTLPAVISVGDNDLCVILSNALENGQFVLRLFL